jgi:hypothetical protein
MGRLLYLEKAMPLKRDPRLQPISRQHHKVLLLAQLLRQDVPAYRGMPAEAAGQRAYALREYHERLVPLLHYMEATLMPAVAGGDAEADRVAEQLRQKYAALAEQFQALQSEAAPALEQLDTLGHELQALVRTTERSYFQRIQACLPAALPPLPLNDPASTSS